MKRVAVIGVGYLGTFHAEKYRKNQKAELVAVVDVDVDRARRTAKKFRCAALSDYRALADLNIDCVSVVTPTHTHYEIAHWVLSQGIDVLLEKPMTNTVGQARELIALAKAKGCILQIGHLERFNPAYRAVERILDNPRFFEARRIAPFTGRGCDVDVVMDLMIHDIDIITHLVRRPLKRVEAIGVPVLTDSVDIANARLTFEGGAVANVNASRAATRSERTIRIFQPDLYISMDYGQKVLKIHTKKKSGGLGLLPEISVQQHKVEERDALADEIDSFLDTVIERKTPEVSGEDGLLALELVEQIRSAFQESWAEMDDPLLTRRFGNFLG